MASSADFVQYICEQLEGVGTLRHQKMFGEYMVYVNERPVVLVCNDTVYMKRLPCLTPLLAESPIAIPYQGAKERYVLDPDQRDTLRQAVALALAVTPLPKQKTPKGTK